MGPMVPFDIFVLYFFPFQFKEQISKEFSDTPIAQLCLIFAGKIIKDHETLDVHNIKDGMTIHLVIKSGPPTAAATSPTPPPAGSRPPADTSGTPFGLSGIGGLPGMSNLGMGSANFMEMQQQVQEGIRNNPDLMRQVMDSPLTQSLMSNPEILRSLIQSNPQMRQVYIYLCSFKRHRHGHFSSLNFQGTKCKL